MRETILVCVLITIFLLMGCATPPKFEDGTRASLYPATCTRDDCGKLPDGF